MKNKLLDYFDSLSVVSKFRKNRLIKERKIAKIASLLEEIVKRQRWKDEYIDKDEIKKTSEILIHCTNDCDDFDYYIARWTLDDNIYILTNDFLYNFELGRVLQLYHNIHTLIKMPLTHYVNMTFNPHSSPPHNGKITFIERVVTFHWLYEWDDLRCFLLKIHKNALKLPLKNCDNEIVNFPLEITN